MNRVTLLANIRCYASQALDYAALAVAHRELATTASKVAVAAAGSPNGAMPMSDSEKAGRIAAHFEEQAQAAITSMTQYTRQLATLEANRGPAQTPPKSGEKKPEPAEDDEKPAGPRLVT